MLAGADSPAHASFYSWGCAGGGTSWSSSCDEAGWTCNGAFCGITAGEKRAMMGILTTTANGMAPYDIRVSIESNEIAMRQDSVVTAYLQTDPYFRSQLGPNDTWTGFSSPAPVYVPHPVSMRYYTVSIYEGMEDPSDTSAMVFGFVPHVYSDSDDLHDSMQKVFYMRQSPGDLYRKIIRNDLLAGAGARDVSPPPVVIPSDPAGETFPQLLYPGPGDLIITEIMKDPDNGVADANGEWFEVLNASGLWLDLSQVIVRGGNSDYYSPFTHLNRKSAMLVAPGATFVYGRTRDTRLNGGARVDAAYGDRFDLSNGADTIILEVNGVGEIDRVEYADGGSWPDLTGKSMMLTDTTLDNNAGPSWAASTLAYGVLNQKGTPNSPNSVAADTPPIGEAGVAASAGSLVITEFLTNAVGLDQNGEWFEIFNRTDSPVVLTGLTVEYEDSTGVSNSFTVATATVLDPGRYFVFARDGEATSPGFPADYDYPDNMGLSNDKGTIRIKDDTGTVIDDVSYNGDLFSGFPDYGDGVSGGWPLPSEFDGRSTALQGTLAQLRDSNYDNNDKTNWAQASALERYGSGGAFKGKGGYGTPGRPNVNELSVTVSMPSSLNANSTSESFTVTVTPGAGYGVNDIDTQSMRLFRTQRPMFLKIGASDIRADFNSFEIPSTVERNMAVTAELTAMLNGDSPQAFAGSATVTVNDTRLAAPAGPQEAAGGDLIITEVMVNGPGDENLTEYFEIYNASNKTIDLAALGVQDGGGSTGDPTPEARSRIYNPNGPYPLRINPGEFKVIGRAGNRIQVGGYDLDGIYMNPDLNFSNSGDEVVIFRLSDNGVVAQMEYGSSSGHPRQDMTASEDRSMALIDTGLDAADGLNWVSSSIPYGDSGHGTPGSANRIAYRSGDVLVSEVYGNPPPGGEPNAEFFELANPDTANPIDLSGLVVTDDAGNTFPIDDYPGKVVSGGAQIAHIPAGGVLVFGNSRGAADGVDNTFDDTYGAGVTGYDYPNGWTLLNTSPGDEVRLIRYLAGGDSVEIHGMGYSSAPAGKSWELDTLSDSQTYSQTTPTPTQGP